VAFLARTLKPTSIIKYLNIVRIMHVEVGLNNPLVENWGLDSMLKGIKRIKGLEVKRKLPITPEILLSIFACLDFHKALDVVFWAACLVGFFGLLRKSNLFPPSAGGHDPSKHLSREHFQPKSWGFELSISWSKNNQYRERTLAIPLLALPGHKLCPVTAVRAAFNRTCVSTAGGPAFLIPHGGGLVPLLYSRFVGKLKSCIAAIGLDPKGYASHSLRRGGATWGARIGLPAEQIQMMGDWHSDAYLLYLSLPMSSKVQTMWQFCKGLPK
jgi:hypothetical protein